MANEWIQVNSSSSTTVGVKKDGTLWSSGLNWHGATGQGTQQGTTDTLTQIGTDTDWKDARVQAPFGATDGLRREADWVVAIKNDQSLWVWGSGGEPWSGFSRGVPLTAPVQVSVAGTGWKRVLPSFGEYHFLVQKEDGSLWESPTSKVSPDKWLWAEVGPDSRRSFIGIKENGTLWGGSLENGILLLDDANVWTDASIEKSRGDLRLAIKEDGTLWFSGNIENFRGEGDLTQLGSDTDWEKVRASIQYVVAMKSAGSLWGWGINYENRLGIIDKKDLLISTPTNLTSLDGGWGDYDTSPLNIILYDEFPTLELLSVEPGEALESGGGSAILRVANADSESPATVTFGGVSATNVTVVNEIRIDCTIPAGTGTVDVEVIQGAESSILTGGFEYITELPPDEPPPPEPTSRLVTVDFQHNFNGADITEVSLITIDGNGDPIGTPVWTFTGPSEDVWKTVSVDVETLDLPGTRLAFRVLNSSGGFEADWAIDEITLSEGETTLSQFSFESDAQAWLTNTENSDDVTQAFSSRTDIIAGATTKRFNRDSNGTPSSNTGPSSGANGTSIYLYSESSSSPSNSNYWAFSPVILQDKLRILSIDTVQGSEDGGDNITITGANFNQATSAFIKFGNTFATNVNVVSSTEITCTTPPGVGTVDVLIIQDEKSSKLENAYTYVQPPVIVNVSFEHNYNGTDLGEVRLFLLNESGNAIIGDGPVWTYNGPSEDVWKQVSLDVSIPNGVPRFHLAFGSVVNGTSELADWAIANVKLTETNGTLFSYDFSDNNHGWKTSSTNNSVPTGPFNGADLIYFGTLAVAYKFTRHTGATPTSGTGPSTGPNGGFYLYTESSDTNNSVGVNFWAFSPPIGIDALEVDSITGVTGSNQGEGTLVTITGNNFRSIASVKFGKNFAENVRVVNSQTIECIAPPGKGTVSVRVLQGNESDTPTTQFEYVSTDDTITIDFSHHFFGRNLKEVALYIIDRDGVADFGPIWSYNGPSEDAWKAVQLKTSTFGLEKLNLVFRVTRLGGTSEDEADWALDQISVSNNDRVLFDHDFETDHNNWTTTVEDVVGVSAIPETTKKLIETDTSTTTVADFRRNSGGTPTLDTGPSTGSDAGFYLYTEGSAANPFNPEETFFWAISPSVGLGKLSLNEIVPAKSILNTNTSVTLKGKNFRPGANVLFGTTPATGVEVIDSETIICVTPVSATPGRVSVTVDQSGDLSTIDQGLEYITTETTTINFEHHFFGANLEKVELFVADVDGILIGNAVWSYSGPSEDIWKPVSVNVELPEKSRLVFKTTSQRGTDGFGDWAVDLVDIQKGGSAVLLYDFELSAQDWETSSLGDEPDLTTAFNSRENIDSSATVRRFNRITGPTTTSSTGPSTGADGGYYIYAETSFSSDNKKHIWAFSSIVGLGDFSVNGVTLTGSNTIAILGENFRTGISATIDGNPLTNINVISSNKFEGTVPEGTASLSDVVVTQDGVSDTIINGYDTLSLLDISFQHHYYGGDLQSVTLYAIDPLTGEIKGSPLWTYSGPSEDAWKLVSLKANVESNTYLAFLVEETGFSADWAIDDVNIQDNGTTILQSNFEIDAENWTSSDTAALLPVTAFSTRTPIDSSFIRRSGSTPSSGTGPSSAIEGSFYIYSEASSGGSFLWAFTPDPITRVTFLLSVSRITPNAGIPAGGDTVTINGNNFDIGLSASVSFGGTPATDVVVLSSTEITCTVPAGSLGDVVDVEVTQDGLTRVLKNAFEYRNASIISIDFEQTYYGASLGEVALFQIDENGEIIGDAIWTYTGPQGPQWISESATVSTSTDKIRFAFRVINEGGTFASDWAIDEININGTLFGFEYIDFETYQGVGWTTNSTATTVSSEAFSDRINMNTATNSGRFNIRFGTTPSGSTGPSGAASGDYYLYTEGSSTSANAHFWLFSPEFAIATATDPSGIEIAKTSPATGGEQGGSMVSILGQNFSDIPTGVTFDGSPATDVVVVNANKITCITPPGTGIADVVVSQDGETSNTLSGVFNYAQSEQLDVTFQHHFNGPELKEVSLYAIDSDGIIISGPVWTFMGDASDTWLTENIKVDIFDSLVENIRLVFKVSNIDKTASEWSIDSIVVSQNAATILNSDFEDIFHGWGTSTRNTESTSIAFASSMIIPDSEHAGRSRFIRIKPPFTIGPTVAGTGEYAVMAGTGGEDVLWMFSPVVFNPT